MATRRIRNGVVAAAAAVALGAGSLTGLGPSTSLASSHREAPLTAADPQIDNTDLYAFRSPDKPNSVTFISNWIPFEEPAGGPNFFLWADNTAYTIKIDNNGDARPDIVYTWYFTTHYRSGTTSFLYDNGPVTSLNDKNLLIHQTYDLWRYSSGHSTLLLHNAKVAPSDVGAASMPNYSSDLFDAATMTFGKNGNGASWVGQADDPFFLDLRVFDLLYGGPGFPESGDDTLAGFNVNGFALQVPIKQVEGRGRIIGVWSTADRPSTRVEDSAGTVVSKGRDVQVSRLGNPLVNEVVVPVGLKDYFNGSQPKDDAQFLPAVQDPELPHVVNAIFGLPVPDSNPGKPGIQRDDLIQVFLTGVPTLNMPKNVQPSEMLRLNLSTSVCGAPACDRLGVIGGDPQGYPNGRRLSDDVIDIALQVVEGELIGSPNSLGDGVNANDVSFTTSFPYLATPWSGSNPSPH